MFRPSSLFAAPLLVPVLSLMACDGGSTGTGGAGGTGGGATTTTTTISQGGGGSGAGGAVETGGSGGGAVETAPFHLVGRFDRSDPARPTASWSGTTFRTRVSGTSLSVALGGAADVHFQIEIDGQAAGKFITSGGDQTYEVATGLSEGEHEVVLVRRNEGYFGGVSFLGFEPGPGASIVETPWPYKHTIELIGDSLTAGYGIEGDSAGCPFTAGTESFYGTYGAIAARNTAAAAHAIAFSGKGFFQNYNGNKDELMPELWLRTITNDPASQWDFKELTPEAVVVNLGTNDLSAPITEQEFVGAYSDLLVAVRERYPSAVIFCVSWAHWGASAEGWVQTAMAQTGDPALRHVGFSIDPADGFGCDYHTNLVTNAKLGAVLTQALTSELGW